VTEYEECPECSALVVNMKKHLAAHINAAYSPDALMDLLKRWPEIDY